MISTNLSNWKEEAWKSYMSEAFFFSFFSGFFFPIASIGKFTAMIILHFHLQPQFKNELFHIYFTSFHSSREIWTQLTSLPMCGFIAQLVEQRTGNAEVTGSNPVEALIFFRLLLSNCLNWKIYCDDHSSLSSTTAVQKWIIFIYFTSFSLLTGDMNSINWVTLKKRTISP